MTRILHVIPELAGGAGRVAVDLVRHAPDCAAEARLCVLYGPDEEAAGSLAPNQLSDLGGRPGFTSPANLLALGKGLRRLCREFRPDIVHSHLRPADLVAAGALAGWPVLQISHQHDTTASLAGGGLRPRLKRQLGRRLYRRAGTRFIFVAEAVERYFADVFGGWAYDSRVICNGADERLFFVEAPPRCGPGEAFVFGTAARLAPEKGIDVLLRAFALLYERMAVPMRLRIAGTGRCDSALRALAAELGLSGSVEFLGQVHEMRGFYNSIDALVMPSRHSEGFPLTIIEAMLCGRPVIATPVAGTPEAVVDGRTGLLTPVDDPLALARAMESFAQDDFCLRLAQQARQDASARFGLRRMLQEVSDFYDATLEASAAGVALPAGEGAVAYG